MQVARGTAVLSGGIEVRERAALGGRRLLAVKDGRGGSGALIGGGMSLQEAAAGRLCVMQCMQHACISWHKIYMGSDIDALQPGAVPAAAAECMLHCGLPEQESSCLAQVRASSGLALLVAIAARLTHALSCARVAGPAHMCLNALPPQLPAQLQLSEHAAALCLPLPAVQTFQRLLNTSPLQYSCSSTCVTGLLHSSCSQCGGPGVSSCQALQAGSSLEAAECLVDAAV